MTLQIREEKTFPQVQSHVTQRTRDAFESTYTVCPLHARHLYHSPMEPHSSLATVFTN